MLIKLDSIALGEPRFSLFNGIIIFRGFEQNCFRIAEVFFTRFNIISFPEPEFSFKACKISLILCTKCVYIIFDSINCFLPGSIVEFNSDIKPSN